MSINIGPILQQKHHPRHGKVVAAAICLPVDILKKSLVTSFEEQVIRNGDRLAVQASTETLTYAELNSAANQLARWILQTHVPASGPVAIILNPGVATIVAILAVLKAGRVYVLMEPDMPPTQLTLLLQMAQVTLVVTAQADQPQLALALPAEMRLLLIEQLPTGLSVANPDLSISPDQPCRLQFTSGSTGVPKLTLKNHHQKLYSAWQYINSYLYSPLDRHALTYRPSSNAASRVVFNPLLSGGSIHIYRQPNFQSIHFIHWLNQQGITSLYLPTVALRELMSGLQEKVALFGVRIIHVGGQTIHHSDIRLL